VRTDQAASKSTTDAKIVVINVKQLIAKKQKMRIFAIVGTWLIITAPYELIPDPIVREILPGAIVITMFIVLTLSGFLTDEF
jgi:hypothetical protein